MIWFVQKLGSHRHLSALVGSPPFALSLQCLKWDTTKFHVWIQLFDLFWGQSTLLINKPWQEVLGIVLFLTLSTTIIKVLPVRLCNQSREKNKSMLSGQYNIRFLSNATELVLKSKGLNFTPLWVYATHILKSLLPISSQKAAIWTSQCM